MGNAVKALLAAAVAALALPLVAGNAAPTATSTVSCKQVWGSFNVQLIGDREWGWNLNALGSVGAPTHKSIIVVWSLGGFAAQQGLNIYGWATATRSRMADRCRRVAATSKQPSLKGLGPVTRVKDRWAFGRKFGCLEKGPLSITTTTSGGKTRVVVRLQQSGKVMAVGELGGGGGWIRGSKSCEAKEK